MDRPAANDPSAQRGRNFDPTSGRGDHGWVFKCIYTPLRSWKHIHLMDFLGLPLLPAFELEQPLQLSPPTMYPDIRNVLDGSTISTNSAVALREKGSDTFPDRCSSLEFFQEPQVVRASPRNCGYTRKLLPNPKRRGNNDSGRAGKNLCDQCRYWRVKVLHSRTMSLTAKCEYSDYANRCRRCAHRGLECGPKHNSRAFRAMHPKGQVSKAQQSIPRLVSSPSDDTLTPFESAHITALLEKGSLFKFVNLQYFRPDKHNFWQVVLRRFSCHLTARPVRYGCILYSLHKNNGKLFSDYCHYLYLTRFYQATCESIKKNEVPSLVYGTFATCMYSIRTANTFHEVEVHFRGFSSSVLQFLGVEVTDVEERFLVECMREKLIWKAAQRFLFPLSRESRDLGGVIPMFSSLSATTLSTWNADQPMWMERSASEIQLKFRLIQVVTRLYLKGKASDDPVYDAVKQYLLERFHRDFGVRLSKSKSSKTDTGQARGVSIPRWSRILDYVSRLYLSSSNNQNSSSPQGLQSFCSLIDDLLFRQNLENLVPHAGAV
jgi:hypothetical protein